MFDQTFVDSPQKTTKPISLLVSTLIQISLLCILLLIPLIYTASLPGAMFKSLLVAPRPPVAPPHGVQPAKPQTGRLVRVFSRPMLIAPVTVHQRQMAASDVIAPPDVAGVGVGSLDSGTGSVPDGILDATPSKAPPPPMEEPKAPPPLRAVRVGTGAAEAKLLNKVTPAYPPLAKATHIQGTVEFSATISKEGNIENLQLVRGHPLLVKAARDAVLQWKYRPTLLNGQPVEVLTQIVVNFTLTQ